MTISRDARLAMRFAALLQRVDLRVYSADIYRLLEDHYCERGRHYHTLNHIRYCLDRLDEVRELVQDAEAVELALWFHDVVYDASADDNELRSAFLFDSRLGVHLPTRRANRIHAMIMATVHPSGATCHDAQFVADIDLSGLSLPREEFLSDTNRLRKERKHLTDSEFRRGTVGFFKKLMARPSIFLTGYFQTNYEKRACRNVVDLTAGMESEIKGTAS